MGVSTRRLEERIKERLITKVYAKAIIGYVSERFNVPNDKLVVVYEPLIASGLRPDLVLVHGNTWFIVEFRTRPSPARDVEQLTRYVKAVEEHVKPKKVIPIMAYIYSRPSTSLGKYVHVLKPMVVLLLRGGTYHVLYENL